VLKNNFIINLMQNYKEGIIMYEYNGKNVMIMLCSKCNIKCKHCYIKYKGDFDPKDAMNLIKHLQERYVVSLNGTEPILNKEYFPLFKMCNQHKIMTNGLELLRNPSLIDELKKYDINEIGLSYHFGIHEDLSIVKTEDLNRLIKFLKENNFKVKLMTSLNKHNYKHINQICESASSMGADYIKFTNMINQGNAQNLDDNDLLNKEQLIEVLDDIDHARQKYDKDKFTIKRCGTFGPHRERKNFECIAGKDIVIITPSLDVYKCIFDIDAGNAIGYVKDNRILLFNNPKSDTSYCEVLKKYNNIV